ncbi:MAG: hypothetical protein CMN03_02470 [Roseibacillus sp.]|nr:hypothetical protein [Roseibacillus sp.]
MTDIDRAIEEGFLVQVGVFDSLQVANEYALVILAMNLDCWMLMGAGGSEYTLYAETAFQIAVEEEFRLYTEEQALSGNQRPEELIYRAGIEPFLLWAMALSLVFLVQTQSLVERFCNSSHGLFREAEWYRPLTSLFLHADMGHLLGNLLVGGIFCIFAAHTFGPFVGWGAILTSGFVGNIFTSWLHYPEPFKSLGASTATFGALGLLVGGSVLWAFQSRSIRRLGASILPLIAGGILLGWFGAGGGDPNSRVDVLAHVMGFVAGILMGLLLARMRTGAGALD